MDTAVFLLCLSVIRVGSADIPVKSAAVSNSTPALTTPVPINCSTWDVTNTNIMGHIYGSITSATAEYDKYNVPGIINAPTVTFSKLLPGCNYNISIFSASSRVCSDMEATIAASVSNVTVTPLNSTSLNVSWTNATGCVTNYGGSVNGSNFTTMKNYQEVYGLRPGCTYVAEIITEGSGPNSSVAVGEGATVAASVSDITINPINSTSLRVSWTNATGCVKNYNGSVNGSNFATMKNYQEVHGLRPGCKYVAEIITEGSGPNSSVAVGEGATVAPPVKSLNITAKNATSLVAHWATPVGCVQHFLLSINQSSETTKENSMEFNDLVPGYSYTVSIIVYGSGKPSNAVSVTTNTYPADLVGVTCGYESSGYSIALSWPPPDGIWTRVEVQLAGQSLQNVTGSETRVIIDGVQPAMSYTISLKLYSGDLSSSPVIISCTTDPRGVIAGVLVAVLILLMVILAIVILRRKPKWLRKKRLTESEVTDDRFKVVPVGKFAEHFHKLSCDQNRGFSEEYENLSTAGVGQSCHTALIPENKAKNRFTNVLPYDSSRVKLTTRNHDMNSDYINANYMPGYGNNNRQYIAAQGPLPNTVNDFWRMIWEQDVKGVVMVTNCNEGGKVKCEQYWSEDSLPQTYGNLTLTVTSEHKDIDWTQREFSIRNMMTSEVRLIKHFHFTAWPDHGVPSGTSALMEFRGIVRNHIESYGSLAPTVVHCSAGVGRTGTLIALDVALQQLETEKAVGLAAFVRKMRLNRPLMVQTESQYIFLHQCIMDKLKKEMKTEEPVYENTDMIYVNSMALRDFVAQNPKS